MRAQPMPSEAAETHQIDALIGVGPDGAAYQASGPDGSVVLLRVRVRDGELERVRRRVGLAALVNHPGAWAVSAEWGPSQARLWGPAGRRWTADELTADASINRVRGWGQHIAEVLAEAHHQGLYGVLLGPSRVVATERGELLVDLTGLDAGAGPHGVDRLCRAPEEPGPAIDGAADVFALGAMMVWARFGPPKGLTTVDGVGRAGLWRQRVPLEATDADVLRAMLAPAPEQRPRAEAVAELLSDADSRIGAVPQRPPTQRPTQRAPRPSERPTAQPPAPRAQRPSDRPTVQPPVPTVEVADRGDVEATGPTAPLPQLPPEPATDETGPPPLVKVGRFLLGALLGEGAMGQVFASEDPVDGRKVAVKVMRDAVATNQRFRRRFDKEVRLLRAVSHPRIANLIDAGAEGHVPYLALQFIEGEPLSSLLQSSGSLDPLDALAIVADVLRALSAVHDADIVHRDVKPANIMVRGEPGARVAVLCDFGIAQRLDTLEDERLTREGFLVGTPHYMSPEQARGAELDGRSDIYALGVVAYELIAGEPPYSGDNATGLLLKHLNETPPPLASRRPDVSDGVARFVHRLLAKALEERPADATAALVELQALVGGAATGIGAHPPQPDDPARMQAWSWTWDLRSSPQALWPLISDTRRLNRALGLTPFETELVHEDGMAWYRAHKPRGGMTSRWDERPMEWVEGERIGTLRVYSEGPLEWLRSVTTLEPGPAGGTRVTQVVELVARKGWIRAAVRYETGVKTRKAYGRLFERFDAHAMARAAGDVEQGMADPFEDAPALEGEARAAWHAARDRLLADGLDPIAVERLARYVAEAPAPALARLRPRALAEWMAVDEEPLIDVCLHAVRAGLLSLYWDLMCPVCRVPSDIAETLAQVADHGHCKVCDLDFDLDFAGSLELVFRAHPAVRVVEETMYCIGGPAQAPHIAVQLRLAPEERLVLNLRLADGRYRLAGRRLPFAVVFRVHGRAPHGAWAVELAPDGGDVVPRSLRSGAQRLDIVNRLGCDVLLRIERLDDRDDALTAADAMAVPAFRALFPHERLAPGMLVNLARVTLLRTGLIAIGKVYADDGPRAFAQLHGHFERLTTVVVDHGGVVLKMEGDGLVCAFAEPGSAVRAALAIGAAEPPKSIRAAVHGGPAYVATLDGRLDYFGRTVHQTAMLLARARAGTVVISEPLELEPDVRRALADAPPAEVVQLVDGLVGLRRRWPVAD